MVRLGRGFPHIMEVEPIVGCIFGVALKISGILLREPPDPLFALFPGAAWLKRQRLKNNFLASPVTLEAKKLEEGYFEHIGKVGRCCRKKHGFPKK